MAKIQQLSPHVADLIAAGEVELAIAQNDVMDYAYNGTDLFAGEQKSWLKTPSTPERKILPWKSRTAA